jgi:hypothetical protein
MGVCKVRLLADHGPVGVDRTVHVAAEIEGRPEAEAGLDQIRLKPQRLAQFRPRTEQIARRQQADAL